MIPFLSYVLCIYDYPAPYNEIGNIQIININIKQVK